MDTYIINAQEYYLANDVRNLHPDIFVGCLKSMPQFIKRHGLSNDEYTWARLVDGSYVKLETKKSNKIDKLMLSCAWVNAKLGINESIDEKVTDEPKADAKVNDAKDTKNYAPDILDLKDHEKLADDEGNVYEIEVRGERDLDKVYFSIKDLSMVLGIKGLTNNVSTVKRGYIEDEDYVKFYIKDEPRYEAHGNKTSGNKKRLFFTYTGFLKCIYSSKSASAKKFAKWAANVVFTAHLGTKPQKQDLVAKLIGVDKKTVREVFSKSVTSQPCIYLIYLGKAKDLADTFKIKDHKPNESIYKFGRSINLTKRMDQHHAKYSKLGCKVELVLFAYIDPIYNNDAENDIKEYFMDAGFKIDNKKYVELVKLDRQSLALTKSSYEKISIDNPVSPTNETPYPRIPRYVRYRDLLLVGLGKMLPPPFRESLHLELMTNVT